MFEKSIFSVVATQASSILIRSSKKKKKKKKKNTLCPVTVLVDSQVSDRCPWASFHVSHQVVYVSSWIGYKQQFLSHSLADFKVGVAYFQIDR